MLFGSSKDEADRATLKAMKALFTAADKDLAQALAVEMGNRYAPVQRQILLAFFVHACFDRLWDDPAKPATLARFHEQALELHWHEWAKTRPEPGRTIAQHKLDALGEVKARHAEFAAAFATDLDKASLYKDIPVRLSEISEAGARALFALDAEEQDRGRRVLLARLHAYFRAIVWRIEHPEGEAKL
ncbi:MAG: hypothetical protein JNK11_13030 [Alphaproteobacteria bacterium]|nr:hypothetical protein [Alphaproteobacteria bacterium]